MDKKNLALGKTNFILIAVGMLIVIIGFILMSGGCSTESMYDASIFNVRRIKVAPVICFIGFISIVYAVARKPADNNYEVKK
ncbi:MAG: DUF3098 domain-containing protein [Prevotella sp.]|nr:DUF3098 domain-containing protein [Prevotella sp.]